MSYQKRTGPLMANSHPGSYCGQDAYNDMFITEKLNEYIGNGNFSPNANRREGPDTKGQRLQGPTNNYEGGQEMETAVRRLTPTECERLQGFPDNWTLIGTPEEVEVKDYAIKCDEEGNVIEKELIGTHIEIEHFYLDSNGKKKKCSDSARYKALGNSICLPFWKHLARRICAQYERDITMGSLFDGIGGFPLAFQSCGAIPIWASEIEEFPIAVTMRRFPENKGEKKEKN